jgi:hypothetical protein
MRDVYEFWMAGIECFWGIGEEIDGLFTRLATKLSTDRIEVGFKIMGHSGGAIWK